MRQTLMTVAFLGLVANISPAQAEPRIAVGQNMGPDGGLLRYEGPDKAWKPVLKQEKLFTGDALIGLLGGARGHHPAALAGSGPGAGSQALRGHPGRPENQAVACGDNHEPAT